MFARAYLFGNLFNAWSYGFFRYLSKKTFAENITNEDGQTLILDHDAPRQADRPVVWNRIIEGDGVTTLAFTSIDGILMAWQDSGGGWSYDPVILGLSGTTLTLQSGTKYKFFADDVFEASCDVGQGTSVISLDGSRSFTLSSSSVWGTDATVPFLAKCGDVKGIIESDQGEYPILHSGAGLTGTTAWPGRKDWPIKIVNSPGLYIDHTTDYLSLPTGDYSAVTITAIGSDSLTTGDVSINNITDRVEFTASGTIWSITFSDSHTCVFCGGLKMYDVSNSSKRHLTVNVLDINASTVTQDVYSHRLEYGASSGRALRLVDTYGVSPYAIGYIGTYPSYTYVTYTEWNGSDLISRINMQGLACSGVGALINDPYGEAQGWQTIGGKLVYNQYKNGSGTATVNIPGTYRAATIILEFELKTGSFTTLSGRDLILWDNFMTACTAYYGSSISSRIGTVAQLWNALNGGTYTSGACPNGSDDNYPNTTLGINTTNGFAYNATSTKLRELLESVFTQGATAANFLESLYTDGVHTSTNVNKQYTLTRVFGYNFTGLVTGDNYLELLVSDFLAIDSLASAGGSTFFLNYERIMYQYSQLQIRSSSTSVIRWSKIQVFETYLIPGNTYNNKDAYYGLDLDYPAGNFIRKDRIIALPPFRTLSEQTIGDLSGSFDYHRDLGDDTCDRLLISAYDDDALPANAIAQAVKYTTL